MSDDVIYYGDDYAESTRKMRVSKEVYVDYNGEPNKDDDPADYFYGNVKGRLIA